MNSPVLLQYPAGSLLRVSQICRDPKTGRPGLVPWVQRTWLKRVEKGEIPPGRLLGKKTRVWTIEEVLAVGQSLAIPVDLDAPEPASLTKARAMLTEKRSSTAAALKALEGAVRSSDRSGARRGGQVAAGPASSAHGPNLGPVAEVAA